MKVIVEDEIISIGEDRLRYDPYMFACQGEADHRLVVKKVIEQWASILADLGDNGMVYLPHSLYQVVECLRATKEEVSITFRCVTLSDDGWSVDLNDINSFVNSKHNVIHTYPQDFGRYNSVELIEALRQAEIAV
jgi:hypothetical protein